MPWHAPTLGSRPGCAAVALAFAVALLVHARPASGAQTVDRVVAAIGNFAITQTDVRREYRFEMFVAKGQIPEDPPSASVFTSVESKLIDQDVLEQQLQDIPVDNQSARKNASEEMTSIREKFKSEADFRAALHALGIDQSQLVRRLETQQRILMMVDERMRPAAAIEPHEIEHYYRQTFLPELAKSSRASPPPLAQVQDKIREILVQQKMNELLTRWLAELRRQDRVRIFGSG